jgi:predicted ATPase
MATRARLTPRRPLSRPALGARRPVVGVCGPDGAGKTTLVGRLRDRLADDGFAVRLGYGYGCLLCRRLDRPSGVAGAAFARGRREDAAAVDQPSRVDGRWSGRIARMVRTLHGHVDAGELMVRLWALRLVTARSGRGAVITDRGPLDGLAKHDPRPGSRLAERYLRLASRYDLIVLLDAPADVLAQRDGEHQPAELEYWRLLYRRWADVSAAAGNEVVVADGLTQEPDPIAVDLLRMTFAT